MAMEIERKFLVRNGKWRQLAVGIVLRQGYLSTAGECAVRVRTVGGKGYLNVKGASVGAVRVEYEYEIPVDQANEMLDNLCVQMIIEKSRYKIPYEGLIWEVDEFHGVNAGLVIAEVELEDEDQEFAKPVWIGEEVTDDHRYYNANLAAKPYTSWSQPKRLINEQNEDDLSAKLRA